MKSLHKLIHNLHPTEKRYIKLRFKANKSDSLLVDYFDFLAKQKAYDFQEFQTVFKKSSPKILQNSLSKLYDAVLKHLRAYTASNSSDDIMMGMLIDVRNLQDKGMLDEAVKLNKKLGKLSIAEETFHIQKEVVQNDWNFNHLRGQLSVEKTTETEKLLKEIGGKENELELINELYRKATTLYYQYFFYERNEETKTDLIELCQSDILSDINLLKSSKSKMSFFEIDAMKYIILGDIKGHHEVRKDQLKLLFTSPVFDSNYLSQLLVLSNVFTYLKSVGAITELEAYMQFLKMYFLPLVMKNSDGVLIEKYYDIYFQNSIYIQFWKADKVAANQLVEEFKDVSIKEFKANNLLVSRTYLSLAQLLILSGDYKQALRHLIEFQSLALDKKNSDHFLESELHLLLVYIQMDKMDVFDHSIEILRKRNRSGRIEFKGDLLLLFNGFVEFYKEGKAKVEKLGSNKKWMSIYLGILKGETLENSREKFYDPKGDKHSDLQDDLLLFLQSKI